MSDLLTKPPVIGIVSIGLYTQAKPYQPRVAFVCQWTGLSLCLLVCCCGSGRTLYCILLTNTIYVWLAQCTAVTAVTVWLHYRILAMDILIDVGNNSQSSRRLPRPWSPVRACRRRGDLYPITALHSDPTSQHAELADTKYGVDVIIIWCLTC